MSRLTPEEMQRIRREEEARVRALEEEQYREQVRHELEQERFRAEVRTELEARPSDPPVEADEVEPAGKALAEDLTESGSAPIQVVRDGEHFVWDQAAPAPHPEPAPRAARARPGVSGRPVLWWLAASLLLVVGITLVIVALLQRGGAPARAALELTLSAGGPIAELRHPDWKPEDLATDDYVISPDGAVTSRPGRGLGTFDAWKAAFETPPPIMNNPFPEQLSLAELRTKYQGSPPDPALPRMRLSATEAPPPTIEPSPAAPGQQEAERDRAPDRGAPPVGRADGLDGLEPLPAGDLGASMSGLLRFVPARASVVVGLDKARLGGSASLLRLHGALARSLGETSPMSSIGGGGLLDASGELVYAGALDGGDLDEEFVVVGATSQGERIRELALAAGARLDDGKLTSLVLPAGEWVVLEPGRFAAARRGIGPAMMAARASGGMLTEGNLTSMLLRVAPAASVFAVLRVQPAQKADLDLLIRGLGRAEVLGATIVVGAQIGATLHLTFPDPSVAAEVLAAFESKRAELAGTPEGVVLGRVSASIEGAWVTLALSLSEAELAGLFAGADFDE